MVSCQKGPTRHAYAWQIGPFLQDTIDMSYPFYGYTFMQNSSRDITGGTIGQHQLCVSLTIFGNKIW